MFNQADRALFDYVNKIINTGATEIEIPYHLLEFASEEGLLEVKRMCKITGVRIVGVDVYPK